MSSWITGISGTYPSPVPSLRVLALTLLGVALLVLALYLCGRNTCPPPDWWLRLFTRSGNFGCVQ